MVDMWSIHVAKVCSTFFRPTFFCISLVKSKPVWLCSKLGSCEHKNMRPLHTATEKDALNLHLEGPTKKMLGYVFFIL